MVCKIVFFFLLSVGQFSFLTYFTSNELINLSTSLTTVLLTTFIYRFHKILMLVLGHIFNMYLFIIWVPLAEFSRVSCLFLPQISTLSEYQFFHRTLFDSVTRVMYPVVAQNYVQHSKVRCISTTSLVGWALGMILAFLVSLQWALVTYWLNLDHYLLVGKCVRLLLDESIMSTTTIAQHNSQILDFLVLSYPTSWSEFFPVIHLHIVNY